jgi:hypothetical protein
MLHQRGRQPRGLPTERLELEKRKIKMIIAIDFDGTIVQNNFPAIGALIPEAADTVKKLKRDGHKIIINTCRSGEKVVEVVNFLLANGIDFDVINDNDPDNVQKFGNNSRKVYAHCYIDDRNVGGLPKWSDLYEWIPATELAHRENKPNLITN